MAMLTKIKTLVVDPMDATDVDKLKAILGDGYKITSHTSFYNKVISRSKVIYTFEKKVGVDDLSSFSNHGHDEDGNNSDLLNY